MANQNINPIIGRHLRARRTMMGLSQGDVAKLAGITFQQIQKYEKGANAMNAHRLYEFAQMMHVPVAYFFQGIEQPSDAVAKENSLERGNASDREMLEMLKAFKRIESQTIRKKLAELLRTLVDIRYSESEK